MREDERAARVALALVPNIGPARYDLLLKTCKSALGAFSAPFAFLGQIPGMTRAAATALTESDPRAGERALERLQALGGSCLLPEDEPYPGLLRAIPDPPPVLFCLGDTSLLSRPSVAVVGSRDHTCYGAEVATRIAGVAAAHGIVTVSGMARGLDAVAHAATLDAGGATIGVLGNGLGVIYPAANRLLYERVADGGLLVTEFPPGERPTVGTFPRRNRLISGLARVTVVVEASTKSGTLITVGSALEQGREVLVVPGPVTSPTSTGTNRLLRDGASPWLEPDDLLAHYRDIAPAVGGMVAGQESPVEPDLPPPQLELWHLCGGGLMQVDELVERTGRSAPEVLADLALLEIGGQVVQVPGRRFRRPP